MLYLIQNCFNLVFKPLFGKFLKFQDPKTCIFYLQPKSQILGLFCQLTFKISSTNTELPKINPKIEYEFFLNLLKISPKNFSVLL